MRPDIHRDLTALLKRDFRFRKVAGQWLQQGQCPDCQKWEVFARADAPWLIKCGRADRCGTEWHAKDLYPEIFDAWSERYPATEANPTASADAYLSHNRGFDLMGLRGTYTQESYWDPATKQSTATVRFALPDGSWWERLIDQPGRFDKKARFQYGRSSNGDCWIYPGRTLEMLGRADEIWITEGIFDAIALEQGAKVFAVTVCQNNVFPKAFLEKLKPHIRGAGPRLVFAFDVGKSGVHFTRRWVNQAINDGWEATAAQVRPDGEGTKLDWNDLLLREKLQPSQIEEYLFNGALTVATSATEKAGLLAVRHGLTSFPLTHDRKTYWAKVSQARVQELLKDCDGKPTDDERAEATRQALQVSEIANCVFRVLYFQRDESIDESSYWLGIDFPEDRETTKAGFSGPAIAAGAEFKKRLLTVAGGGQWLGATFQLDRLLAPQLRRIKRVEAIPFTGYSIDHGAYIFGDLAVKDGRLHQLNEDDYFELGKLAIKLRSSGRILQPVYDADKINFDWLPFLWTAYRERGLVALAFWFGSFFAEQIRRRHEAFTFLEMWGDPDTGKSTLVEFLWKLCGRANHEGIDPMRATPAGLARTLANVGNLPVVFMEGDRTKDAAPHSRSFDWEELKSLYNGRTTRTVGKKNNGLDTDSSPFRGAIVIEQNEPVKAILAIRMRICAMHFTTDGFTAQTKAAAERISAWPIEDLSGFIVHAARAERQVLERYAERFPVYHDELLAHPEIHQRRVARCHAQLLAILDAMTTVVPITPAAFDATTRFIRNMAVERQQSLSEDHPVVQQFWEVFDFLVAQQGENPDRPVNHSRKPETIALSLNEVIEHAVNRRQQLADYDELKKHLKTSKSRRFVAIKTVRSCSERRGSVHCWVFQRGASQKGDNGND